jgi:hypothetical protein
MKMLHMCKCDDCLLSRLDDYKQEVEAELREQIAQEIEEYKEYSFDQTIWNFAQAREFFAAIARGQK